MSQNVVMSSNSPEETIHLGEKLGHLLRPGDVILLSGELGAGKTVFVQGLARGLEVHNPVSSKSFVLLGEYEGRILLYHADLYRLETVEEVEELSLDDYCTDGALVVEWPEIAMDLFAIGYCRIQFTVRGLSARELTFEVNGERYRDLLAGLTVS